MVGLFIVSGCALLPRPTPNPGTPCDQVYEESTCLELIALATHLLNKAEGVIVSMSILPEPSVGMMATGGATPIRVRLRFKDGTTQEAALCGGASMEPVCAAQPRASPS